MDSTLVVCPHDGSINRVPTARLTDRPECGRCHQPLFAGRPTTLSALNFDIHLTRSGLPMLVDFWAPWCGPCLMMAPAFEKAATVLAPQFVLGKLNTEDEPGIAARYGIRSIPTLILFAGGNELARHSGAMGNPEQIARWATGQLSA
jgi:thioredoxin 2